MVKRLEPIDTGEFSSDATKIPRANPARVDIIIHTLTIMALGAFAADAYMSWEGFNNLPVSWWVTVTLTAIIASSQLASGLIQSLGGNPFSGVGGDTSIDTLWALALKSLYAIDIFSNFSGFGATQYLNLDALLNSPSETVGMIVWYGALSVLLAFGDELLLRQRDRLEVGKQKNEILWQIHQANLDSYKAALQSFKSTAIKTGREYGKELEVDFDWLK